MSINIQTENNELKKIAGTYGTDNESHITTDSELSLDSENPIQNKIVTKELNDLENSAGTIKLTKEYIQEHNVFSSFISGLKENTCYVFVGTNSTISEMNILTDLGFSPKQGIGNIKISCGYMKYNIFVEFNNGSQMMQRLISYNPNAQDNYSISDWCTFVTTDDTVSHATSADNADTVDGYHVWTGQSPPYQNSAYIPLIKTDGVVEIGRYVDFHVANSSADFDARINVDTGGNIEISSPTYAPKIIASKAFSGYSEPQFLVANPTYPNASVQAYVDQEGANFRLATNQANNYFEMDTLGNVFRFYHYFGGKTPTLISSVGSGEAMELQIARATKDSDGNVIKDTYLKKDCLTVDYGGGITQIQAKQYGSLNLLSQYGTARRGMIISSSTIDPYDAANATTIPKISFGQSGKPWNGFYSYVSMTTVSDERQKEHIRDIDMNTVNRLIEMINGVTYQLKTGESGRTHYGMISQQVEAVLNELGIDSKDFAAFIKSPVTEDIMEQATDEEGNLLFSKDNEPIMVKVGEKETGEYIYMLRYEEFIPILWKNAQDKNKQIEELQHSNKENIIKINELEQRIAKLEEYINNTI